MKNAFRQRVSKGGVCLGVVGACVAVSARADAFSPAIAVASIAAPDGERVFVHSFGTGENVLEFVCSSSGCWQKAWINGPQTFAAQGSRLLAYYEPNVERDHLFFVEANNHIHEWSWPDTPGLASNVVDVDVTGKAGAPLAVGLPVSGFPGGALENASTLTGFVDGYGIEHVFYEDGNGLIDELYHNPSGWFLGHVAQGGTAAEASNGRSLTSMWDGSCQHIFYRDGHDLELWEDYNCGTWSGHRLSGAGGAISPTVSFGGTAPPPLYLTSYDFGGQEPVAYLWGAYRDGNGTGLRTAYCGEGVCWGTLEDTGTGASGTVPFFTQDSPLISVNNEPIYVGSDARIYTPSESNVSLQAAFGNPNVFKTVVADDGVDFAVGTQLSEMTGFVDMYGISHIFYIGTAASGGDLFEYYRPSGQSSWSTNRLSNGFQIQ
jgi:hypothetical protein